MLLKLFLADVKMLCRNRQALFWSLAFPLMFTVIFGFFFGGETTNLGNLVLVNNSKTELAKSFETALDKADIFKISKSTDLGAAKNDLKTNKIVGIIEIPKNFGAQIPDAPTKIKITYDPANAQTNQVLTGFAENFFTQINFKIQNAKQIYGVEEEKTTTKNLTYFDFVLTGLIGMALMNASIQGVAIAISKYREDKILKRITTTPLKTWKFIMAEILSRLILNFIQVSLILVIGHYFFSAHIYGSILIIYALAILGAFLFQAMGFVIATMSKTTDAAQGMAMSITIPMMFLAGVFFPIDQLPKWLSSVVQYLPLAPLLRMLRQTALENLSPFTNPTNMIIVLAWILGCLLISLFRFRLADE